MKWVLSLQHQRNVDEALSAPADEIVLGCRDFSRLGQLDWGTCVNLAQRLGQGQSILAWDVLMTENQLHRLGAKLQGANLRAFGALRVQDLGALEWARRHCPHANIHLLLEHGGHNLKAIEGWIKRSGKQIKRLVFSPQIPLLRLKQFVALADSMGVESELMVLGPLLLFSTPRRLLSPRTGQQSEDSPLGLMADSLEGPHKNFALVENGWGTFMFHPKDLSLVHALGEFEKVGLTAVRFDLFDPSVQEGPPGRPIGVLATIRRIVENSGHPSLCQEVLWREYPRPLFKGLFEANKTERLFSKLKNQHITDRGPNYIGDVASVAKKCHLAIHVRHPQRPLRPGDRLEYRTPEGHIRHTCVQWLKDSSGAECHQRGPGQIAVLNHTAGVSVKTAAYWRGPEVARPSSKG